ncbi:MAG: serine protease [Planctomycetota bacterium]|nr:serine protease [Planctomycetota bacterium]
MFLSSVLAAGSGACGEAPCLPAPGVPSGANAPAPSTGEIDAIQARDRSVYERVAPSVLGVECRHGPKRERFYGSGVVISDLGYVLTSTTAVPEGAKDVRLLLADGRALDAEVAEVSSACEAVLLKAQGKGVRDVRWPALRAARDEDARAGDRVFSAGNAHQTLGRDGQVYWSAGVLSGRYHLVSEEGCSRYRGPVLESDAAVNHGCDGGALVDARGRLLGLLSLSHARTRWLGTAVPLHEILARMPKAAKALASNGGEEDAAFGGTDAPLARALQQAAEPARRAVVRILFERGQDGTQCVTGVLVRPRGTVLTSAFNLEGAGGRAQVVLADGRRFAAEIKGCHLGLDLAALVLAGADGAELPGLELSGANGLAAGDLVTVLGAPLNAEAAEGTCTNGIVSALDRLDGCAVQTDARINFGNAGGPAIGLDGRLLGVAAQVNERKVWAQSSGVGFFAPSDKIAACLPDLLAGKTLCPAPQAFLGVRPAVGETELAGVKIAEVVERSAAWRAGLRPGDVVTGLDGADTRSWPAVITVLKKKNPGDPVEVRFVREERALNVRVTLDTRTP